MDRFTNLGKNTFWVFIGNIGSKIIGLLMLPFYTRWLSVDDYGTTDIIIVYATLLVSIIGACIPESIFVFPKSQPVAVQKQYFTSGILCSLILFGCSLCIFSIIDAISVLTLWNNSFINYLWWIFFYVLSMYIQQYTQQFCRSIDKVKVFSYTGIIQTVGICLFSFLFIYVYGKGVYGFMMAYLLANVTASLYSLIASNSYSFFDLHSFRKERIKEMLHYSIPLIPNGVMWWLVSALNRPVLEASVGLHAIGIFAVANKFPAILSMLVSVFFTAWQISVIEEFNKPGYQAFYNSILKAFTTLLFIIFLIISIVSPFLVKMFAGPDFYEAANYIPLLMLGTIFSGIATVVGGNFSATRESKYYFYSSVWAAIVSVVLNLLLIPILHIWGAVLSMVFSFAVIMLSRNFYVRKHVSILNIKYYMLLLLGGIILICMLLLFPLYWSIVYGVLIVSVMLYLNRSMINLLVVYLKKKK
jgi:O-antigen/teichoic acid export membrane protein